MDANKTPQQKPSILAVDDLPANLIALEAVLSREYNVVSANSGAEAIEILKKRQDFSVILMDLQMPLMDGYEASKRIKQMENCQDIPIILITAFYKEEPFIKKGYEVGAVDYFSKPFDPDILRKKIAIYSAFRQKADVLKERERQLRASEELLEAGRKLSTVLESLAVGVLIADREGRICQTNEVVFRICKSTEPLEHGAYGEILGWWDSSGQLIKSENGPLLRALHEGQTTHNKVLKIKCLDGTPKTILASSSPLLGLDGKIMGAVVVIQDLTESKLIEEDFEQRITKLISVGVEIEQSVRH